MKGNENDDVQYVHFTKTDWASEVWRYNVISDH